MRSISNPAKATTAHEFELWLKKFCIGKYHPSLLKPSFDQIQGNWPSSHPLPLPQWSDIPKRAMKFHSLYEYEHFISNIELLVQNLLSKHNYNTIGNFISLYKAFKTSKHTDLSDFFGSYSPNITDKHHTCVGLGLELRKNVCQMENKFPGIADALYLVSCEECIENVTEYINIGDDIKNSASAVEKEHILMALRVEVEGRKGIVLCDPGYHIARAVTIMEDGLYPHTGWFIQANEDNVTKEYHYSYNKVNPNFINWFDRETRNGIQKIRTSLIFITKPYITAIDVTERRNLVYDFRSLIARDIKGHLVAGLYFPLREGCKEFTLFYQKGGKKERIKLNFEDFLYPEKISESKAQIVSACNEQLNLSENENLLQHLNSLARLMNDQEYIKQVLTINGEINDMT